MDRKIIKTNYVPRGLQEELHYISAEKRFMVLNLHRRFGKTVFAINDMVDVLLRKTDRQPQGAYIAPTYGQAKRVAWDIFKQYFSSLPNVQFKEGDLQIIIPRPHLGDNVKLWLLGAENPDSLRGMYLDYGTLDEYASMSPIIWSQVVRPALSDRKGKGTFIGTPQGMNHFYDIYIAAGDPSLHDWFSRTITVEDSGYISAEELESARKTMTEDEYNQEFMCSFTAALTGAYYSKYLQTAEAEGRITEVPYDPRFPVATFWDLGISDSMSIWFIQKIGQFYNVIDYLEFAGKGIEYYVKELFNKPYVYGKQHFPHDVKQRSLITGKERMSSFQDLGIRPIIAVPKCKQKMDMINAVRFILPLCRFDRFKCGEGLNALRNYQAEWDPKKKIFKDTPKHDWSSHAADSFGCFAMGQTDSSFQANYSIQDNLPTQAIIDYNELDY